MGFTTKDLQLLCNKTENTPLWGGGKPGQWPPWPPSSGITVVYSLLIWSGDYEYMRLLFENNLIYRNYLHFFAFFQIVNACLYKI